MPVMGGIEATREIRRELPQLVETMKWFRANMATASAQEIESRMPVIEKHLRRLQAAGFTIRDSHIQELLDGIRADRGKSRNEWKTVKFLRGEPADIVDEQDRALAVTEIGFAHFLGLRHRTANAIVLTPQGKVYCS
jgi:hypothetical protein